MFVDFVAQNYFFLYSLLVGTLLGAIYDVFRIIRIWRSAKSFISPKREKRFCFWGQSAFAFIEDILYFFIVTVILDVFIFHANSGQVRLYSFIGLTAGFFAYYHTVGRIVMKFSLLIIRCIKTVFSLIYMYLISPIIKVILKIVNFFIRLLLLVLKFAVKMIQLNVYRIKTEKIKRAQLRLCYKIKI